MRNLACIVLLYLTASLFADAQRFLYFDPPMGGPARTLRYHPGDEITLKMKDDDGGFYTGYITEIRDSVFFINHVPVRPYEIEAIRIRRHKGRAIIPRAIGWGAHVYIAARLINSLINHHDPVITPLELGITLPIIAGYYVYEFGINTKKRTYKVNSNHPVKIIILEVN